MTVTELLPPELIDGFTLARTKSGSVNHLFYQWHPRLGGGAGTWLTLCENPPVQQFLFDGAGRPLCKRCNELFSRRKG